MNKSCETEVSGVEDSEFTSCYLKLIANFCQTPEEAGRQLTKILLRVRAPGRQARGLQEETNQKSEPNDETKKR